MSAAAQGARPAAETEARLRLVIKSAGDADPLSGILTAYARQPDARRVDILFGGAADRAGHVRDGKADMALPYMTIMLE
ncbi:hypothetical protein [Streptomyces sp. OE57]|uniref:hypothetical protein n=1 Tax=Streptomyces lacaronensis TaxID=3379885 RepID=UPI0039B7869D